MTVYANGVNIKERLSVTADFRDFQYGALAADEVYNNDDAFGDVPGMSVPVGASQTWLIFVGLAYDSATAADFKYTLSVPTDATGRRFQFSGLATGTAAVEGDLRNFSATTLTGTGSAGGIGAGSGDLCIFAGYVVVTSTTAGNVQVQAAQNTANVSNTTLQENSFIYGIRIA